MENLCNGATIPPWIACRRNPDREPLTVEQAIGAMPLAAAWQLRMEGEIDSLEVGKLADRMCCGIPSPWPPGVIVGSIKPASAVENPE